MSDRLDTSAHDKTGGKKPDRPGFLRMMRQHVRPRPG